MKNVIKGILAFILTQVIIDIVFYSFFYRLKHPFAFMFSVDDAGGYLFVSSLLFLPVYFIFGFFSAKVFRLKTGKSLVVTATVGMVFLSSLWVYFVGASNGYHASVLVYAILNIPAGWAYMPISNTAGYMNGANLFFTILPPISFTVGIGFYLLVKQNKLQKNQYEI